MRPMVSNEGSSGVAHLICHFTNWNSLGCDWRQRVNVKDSFRLNPGQGASEGKIRKREGKMWRGNGRGRLNSLPMTEKNDPRGD